MARASAGDEAKKPIKLSPDIHDMIEWIKRIEGVKDSASLIEPMFRDELTQRYLSHKPIIDQIKAKEAQIQTKDDPAPVKKQRRVGGG